LSIYPQQDPKIRGNSLRFVIQLVPGEVGDRVARGGEAPIAGLVFSEGRAGLVGLPAVELDDLFGAGPVAVDLEALAAGEDPLVEAAPG